MIAEMKDVLAFFRDKDAGPLRDAAILVFCIAVFFLIWLSRVLKGGDEE